MTESDTICGYPLSELLTFADLCRKQGISNDELHQFVTNCAWAYDLIQREYQKMLTEECRKCIEKLN